MFNKKIMLLKKYLLKIKKSLKILLNLQFYIYSKKKKIKKLPKFVLKFCIIALV